MIDAGAAAGAGAAIGSTAGVELPFASGTGCVAGGSDGVVGARRVIANAAAPAVAMPATAIGHRLRARGAGGLGFSSAVTREDDRFRARASGVS